MTALLDQIAFRLDGRDYFIKLSMIITDDLFVVKNLKMAFAKANILRQTKAFVWLSPEYKYVRTYNISKTLSKEIHMPNCGSDQANRKFKDMTVNFAQ